MPHVDDNTQFKKYAGTVIWPQTPDALGDTTICPACLKALTSIVCLNCGLDLRHPAAAELSALSHTAVDVLEQRLNLIGRIRYESNALAATPETAAQVPAATVPAEVFAQAEATPESAAPAAPVPSQQPLPAPLAPAQANTVPPKERRSSVQMILLIVGISLLSIFAIFFLVYAFINYGIIWRSVIIATITVAAFVAASLLRRRSLTVSAEGLAVFALVLVYLDAFALRANDFFGLGMVADDLYWGTTLTLTGLGFVAWHRLSRVRAASIVGWATIAPGLGLLVWGLTDGVQDSTRAFIAIAVVVVAGFTQVLIPRPAFAGTLERMLVLTTAAVSTALLYLASWVVAPVEDWGGTIACAVVALIAITHAVIATTVQATATTRAFGHVFSAIGGVSAATAAGIAATRIGVVEPGFAIAVPVLAATVVTLALEGMVRRLASSVLRRTMTIAAWSSAAMLALTLLIPLIAAFWPTGVAISLGLGDSWQHGLSERLSQPFVESGLAVLTLACVLVLTAIAWTLGGSIRPRGVPLVWGSFVVLVLAVALLDTLWMLLAGWLLLAVAALVTLIRMREQANSTPTLLTGYRGSLIGLLVAAGSLAFLTGWASLDSWATTTVAVIGLLLLSRVVTRSIAARATLLGGSAVLLLIGVGAAARHLAWEATPSPVTDLVNVSTLVGLVAALLLAGASISYSAGVSTLDRRTLFWIAAGTAGAATLLSWPALTAGTVEASPQLLLPQFATSLASSIILFGALVLWVGQRANAPLRPERITAAIALGPAIYWLLDSFARVLQLPDFAQSIVPITAAMLAAAGALTITLLRPSTSPRWAREAGVALVGVPAVLAALSRDDSMGWLVLVIAAVTVLLVAIDSDGLFSSASPRRQLGWLALVLAIAGLWWRLSGEQVDTLEPYVLPVAGALLVIALLIGRSSRRADASSPSKAAPLVALAGLLIAILPLAMNAVTGELLRAVVLFAASAALLLAGSLIVGTAQVRPYLDAAALAGGIGVLIVFAGRAATTATDGLAVDAWLAAGLAVLLVAAFGQARQRGDASIRWRSIASQALGLTGLAAVLVFEARAFESADYGLIRVIAVVLLFAALHVIAFTIDLAPFTRLVAWMSIVFAGIAIVIGLAAGTLDPLELGTVPVAIALIASGSTFLSRNPTARSWPWLGPGVLVLLVPSLLATAGPQELWRLVALGVVAVTVLIIGAVRRLQAPFAIGAVVALIHGFATFAPQIRAVYESQEWWLWAGLAGVLLVALAIRYEQRIRNLKSVAMRIAALR